MVGFAGGNIRFSHWRYTAGTTSAAAVEHSFFGCGYSLRRQTVTNAAESLNTQRAWLPIPVFVILTAAYPAYVGLRRLVRARDNVRHHRCPKCDYSLIGLTEPRCPECGASFQVAAEHHEDRFVDPRATSRRLAFATIISFSIFSGLLWFIVSHSSSNPVLAPSPMQRLLSLARSMPHEVGDSMMQKWTILTPRPEILVAGVRTGGQATCPICKDALTPVFVVDLLDANATDGASPLGVFIIGYHCSYCRGYLDESFQPKLFPLACAKCGHVVRGGMDEPLPWCDECKCPKCGWTPEDEREGDNSPLPDSRDP